MSLLETMVAVALLLIAMAGVMTVTIIGTTTTEDQGHLSARTTEYASDKMEQLMSLAYGDTTSDTTAFPTANSGGTGLTVGGSSDPTAPVNQYVDYLDLSGNPLGGGATAPSNWYYVRVWKIETPTGTTNLKRITVTSKVRNGVGAKGAGALPQSTLVALKTSPF